MKKTLLLCLVTIIYCLFNSAYAQSSWDAVTPGANAGIRDLTVDNSGNLYVCGDFTSIGGIEANNIALFNGQTWNSLNSELGFSGDYIYRIQIIDGILYAVGQFSQIGGVNATSVAKWDGSNWVAMGNLSGSNQGYPIVTNIIEFNDELYIGGDFLNSEGNSVNGIAKWNGFSWIPVGSGIGGMYPTGFLIIEDLIVYNNNLVISGEFSSIDGVQANAIARYDGTTWFPLNNGAPLGFLFEMLVYNEELYVGGVFTNIDNISVSYIAKWDGANWSTLPNSEFNSWVGCLSIYNNSLVVGGDFTTVSGTSVNHIAIFDGQNWTPFAEGFNDVVSDIQQFNGKLYCSGTFTQAGSQTMERLATWNECSNYQVSPSILNSLIGSTIQFTGISDFNNSSIQWQTNHAGLGWQNIPNNSTYNGASTNTLSIENINLSNHNQEFRILSTTSTCIDTSNIASLNILDTCITNVTVYDTLLTTVTDTLIINTTITSINPPSNQNILKVFPNPANSHLTVDYGNFSTMSGYTLKIVNAIGQIVFTTSINQQTSYIDLSTWTGSGIYYVQLLDIQNNTIENRKIIIQ